jgi:hypothetical protein
MLWRYVSVGKDTQSCKYGFEGKKDETAIFEIDQFYQNLKFFILIRKVFLRGEGRARRWKVKVKHRESSLKRKD